MAEAVREIADHHRRAEAPREGDAPLEIAYEGFPRREDVVGLDVPGADGEPPRSYESSQLPSPLAPELEVVLEGDGLAVEHEMREAGVDFERIDDPVDRLDQLPPEVLEGEVPFAVPVRVRDDPILESP